MSLFHGRVYPYPQGYRSDLPSAKTATSEVCKIRFYCALNECFDNVEILFVPCGYFLLKTPMVLYHLQTLQNTHLTCSLRSLSHSTDHLRKKRINPGLHYYRSEVFGGCMFSYGLVQNIETLLVVLTARNKAGVVTGLL
jgi:hypothetical protein